MAIIIEGLRALMLVALPLGMFTSALVWWGLKQEHLKELTGVRALGREIKLMSKKQKKSKDTKVDAEPETDLIQKLVQKKWARFGGGFYGIVGLFTLIVIEIGSLIDTVVSFGGFLAFLRQLGVDTIINVFIESLSNFIAAIAWPMYWMQRIDAQHSWLWFVAAYAGYWAGIKLAQRLSQRSGSN